MQIDKSEIINFLKDHGQHDQAATADKQLPETVDTDEHGGLLAQHGISVQELLSHLGGDNLGKLL